MAVDIIFIVVFLSSISALWYLVSRRIPELNAVPDYVMSARFEEDSAKLRLFILHFKIFFREKRYKYIILNFLGKVVYKIHIFLLRFDNLVIVLLKKIRGNGNGGIINGWASGDKEYWEYLKKETPNESPFDDDNGAREIRVVNTHNYENAKAEKSADVAQR